MKKVVLIGDSIRMGYDKYIKDALSGVAEVYYPDENCRFSQYVLRYAHNWKSEFKCGDDVDLVHWNAGLWDVLELFGDEPLTPLDTYGENILRIYKRLKFLFPKAKFVFATSTSVNEEIAKPDFFRHNKIIEKYNKKAVDVLSSTDTYINDLYPLTKSFPDSYRSDFVHFYTPEGTEQIGGRVLSVISKILDIKPNEINIKDFKPENYSADNIAY